MVSPKHGVKQPKHTNTILFSFNAANIEYSDLKVLRDNRLGSGAVGTVWKGVWIPGGKVVAVKEGDQIDPREVGIKNTSHVIHA